MMAKQTDPRLMQAIQALASGYAIDAEILCNAVLHERKRDDLALALRAQACNALGKYEEAMQSIKAAIAKNNKRSDYHGLLGDLLTTRGEFRSALDAYDKALKINPAHHGVIAGKANTWLRLNEPLKARGLVEPIAKQGNEDLTITIVYAKALIEVGDPMQGADVLLKRLPAENEPIETRRSMYFVLGKAMEKAGEYQSAFEAYVEGNKLSSTGYDFEQSASRHHEIVAAFPETTFNDMPESTIDGENLVFIVGMLRSGSTLTEQIIDAHPRGQGVGEVEYLQNILNDATGGQSFSTTWSSLTQDDLTSIANRYVNEIAKHAKHDVIVDKQLGNFLNVGAISKLFPKAKIIHCSRNPLSMGLSCFAQKLPPNTNAWASTLEDIGQFYNEYMRLMKHWELVIGDNMLNVSYEVLTTNQESMTRTILEHCGLEYDERCMRFWETGRTVLTLSQDQVRKPMYTDSIARHERFGNALDVLKNIVTK